MPDQPFWTRSPAQCASALGCGVAGLTSEDALVRLKTYGRNADAQVRETGLIVSVGRRLLEPMCLVLIAAAVVSAGTGDAPSAVIILIILGVSVALDTAQEGSAKRAAEALRQSVAVSAEVKRDGKFVSVDAETVVPGDVFRVGVGDIIPADALVLEASAFSADEAALTGEPYGVVKRPGEAQGQTPAEAGNALFRGAVGLTGEAVGLAVGTGANTLFGEAAKSLNAAAEISPFQHDLRALGFLVARATAVLVVGVLAANVAFGRPLIQSLMFSVALAVGLTPELLPMITTVTLSRGAVRMARKKVIVKRLSAIHDLGAMTVLCTDKTGTLTSARIELAGSLAPDGQTNDRPAMLAAVCARLGGDKGSLDIALTNARPDPGGWTRRGLFPFDYQRRMGAVLADGPEGLTLIVKGAPEAVMAACASAGGAPFDAAARKAAAARVQDLAASGLRAVAVASRPWVGAAHDPTSDDEANLTFEGLCTFADPPKATAPAAVARLAAAGVRVVILSGDDPVVVGRLAKIVGLRAQQAIVGADLHVLSTDALRVQTRDTDVFARLSPDQKVRIVHALRDAGEIVGFMGDGVNDAPGIRAADVGLSVDGATGVARAAADMILMDSDLAVVADGVEEGRRTFANILKYVRMGSSSNFGNMLSMAAASLFLPFLPMLATQILLNNLLYDVSEIGIPFDNVRATDIARPQRWRMHDIVRFAGVMGPLSSAFDLATFGVLFLWFQTSPEVFRTGWFVESIATQTLVIFIIRTRGRPWRDLPNPFLTITTLASLALALAIPFSPAGEWFGFHNLPPHLAIALSAIVAAYLVCAEAFKPLAVAQPLHEAQS
ncbi:Mg2+-importing ATPase [Roseiarcus fermentans]|uniref:Magnesium-transporting ATPase, P-type 1 n=1 Tax=Roseiarcus fermentans TaxID=1473586 RepID=A0A366FUT6_9HYPH|nr:magnesium-translocating P-type ATPase [Roseiarcus fermentans]RBP18337.1 Mg2+-importing ATPase [Roseiarcus fermentans]